MGLPAFSIMRQSAQRTEPIFSFSGSLASSASISGSQHCQGHARIVGAIFSDASSLAGSGLIIKQSIDERQNWDYVTACTISACNADDSAFSIEVIGDSVAIEYRNGATIASNVRMKWYLRPL